ncbi:beta,beta-carotene 15,15'-dioxygenase-like [Patella vulgata]|uniref:beta,beta-carotene 15,15'-dioxygenase-like n=1 Tax=Patella vulgata TaxID=6465 RepID=UPI0024A7E1A1|nr:beta,beta-carotene 15,15'-dioxygenase-like [Patella vulgata]
MGERHFMHSFDAFAKLSSWRFNGNKTAYFSTKFIQSSFYNESMATNDIAPYLLFEGVVPPFGSYDKLKALVRGIDNMNVNVYKFFNEKENISEYVALNDFWKIYQISPRDLSTKAAIVPQVGEYSLGGQLGFLDLLSSAHPLPEPGTNNHITFLSSVSLLPFWSSNAINLIRIKSAHDREVIARWDVERVPYMHSFSVTENYAILFASPFYVNVVRMLQKAEPFECLDWYPDHKTTVYIVNLKTGELKTMTTVNVFTMHHVNAYERKGKIIVDISAYPSPEFVKSLQMKVLFDPAKRNAFDAHALLKRFRINLEKNKINYVDRDPKTKIPYTVNLDMPTINENYRARRYCFVYGIVLKKDNINLSHISIVKRDMCRKGRDKALFMKYHYPSEAWFVPNPRQKSEDDGVLLLPILDGVRQKSYLAIINPKTMKIINRSYLPIVVPFSLHGRFFDEIV